MSKENRCEALRSEVLEMCEGHNGGSCDGDASVGIPPCRFYEYGRGCVLETAPYKSAAAGLNRLSDEVHENAVAHGWWDEERSFPEVIALVHSELSEALEEYRNGRPLLYFPCNAGGVCTDESGEEGLTCGSVVPDGNGGCKAKSHKPEGVAIELADAIIRILDYCGKAGIDIEEAIAIKHEYNKTRPYRHGGKKC